MASRCGSEPPFISHSRFNLSNQGKITERVFLTSEGDLQASKAKTTDDAPKSATSFDPQALLDPQAAAKRGNAITSNGTSVPSTSAPAVGGMIERLHNVSYREDYPQKRVKKAHEGQSKAQEFQGAAKSTPIGQFIKEKKDSENNSGTHSSTSTIVDLTGDDNSEDIVAVDAVQDQDSEVCLGRIDGSYLNVYTVPSPKVGAFQGNNPNLWPPMMLTFRRDLSQPLKITAVDPRGNQFGSLDVKTASAVAPLMDAKGSAVRVQPRLPGRKKTNTTPGQAVSESIMVYINLYAPRKYVEGIGRMLRQRQVQLVPPTMVDRAIQTVNPHAVPLPVTVRGLNTGLAGGVAGNYNPRTVEEIRSDVLGMFDNMTKHEALPEGHQNSLVKTPLLPHQKQALVFFYRRETGLSESGETLPDPLWREKQKNGNTVYYNVITGIEQRSKPALVQGGILADLMGLGKTLSILSLAVSTLKDAEEWSRKRPAQTAGSLPLVCCSKATLLVCPTSTVANWEEQIQAHITPKTLKYHIYHGPSRIQNAAELAKYDLVITTYTIIAMESGSRKPLTQINWFRIVLDEAHIIRQQTTRQSLAVCALSAQRRWAVTGTPVQNRLDDLGALIKFLRIKPFDDRKGFNQYIMAPFKNADPEILPKLRLLVDSITLRRAKDKITLPDRRDLIERLQFTEGEQVLYDWFEKDSARKVTAITGKRTEGLGGKSYAHILRAILRLRLICAHGQELLSDEDMKLTQGLSASNAIDLGDEDEDQPALTPKQAFDMLHLLRESDLDRCAECNKKIEVKDTADDNKPSDTVIGRMTPCYHIICTACFDEFLAKVLAKATSDNFVTCPLCEQYVRVSFFELRQDKIDEDEEARAKARENPKLAKQLGRYNGPHTKTRSLLQYLMEDQDWSDAHPDERPIKSVVFSGWTSHLDLIQLALEDHSVRYTRLDGRMSRVQRSAALATFRDDAAVRVMLVSIGAGGLGLNLTTASRAYVMEPQFNPAAEAQAVDRVHRLGQERAVTVRRFIMAGSFEEKMLELQRKKMALADLSLNRNIKLDKQEAARQRLEELRGLFR